MGLLDGKTAIVTGAARGIGKAIALKFASEGANIAFTDLVIDENAENTAKEIEAMGVKAKGYASNAANFEDTEKVVAEIHKDFGRIDILVNNAGIMLDSLIPMVTDSQIQKTFEVNVFAMMHFIQYVSKVMKRQHSGSIVNAASIMGISGNYAQMVYAASKGAVIALTKSAAKELAKDGIRVNAVAPGTINTSLLQKTPEETLDKIKSRICWGQLGTPEEVANAYMFLASDLSSYISGQVLGVDGMMIN